ncbi:unnamed protein product, partial [Polarella glacialis]
MAPVVAAATAAPIVAAATAAAAVPQLPVPKPPPVPLKPRKPLHPSALGWPGPAKAAWGPLLSWDLDPALRVKAQQRAPLHSSRDSGQRVKQEALDSDDEAAAEDCAPNPRDDSVGTDGAAQKARPVVAVPSWSSSRAWVPLIEVFSEEAVTWQPRRLSSRFLRPRRKGRSVGGGNSESANPQEPPPGQQTEGGSCLLLSVGGAARKSVRLVKWRTPALLELPAEILIDPARYTGSERGVREKRRPPPPPEITGATVAPSSQAPGASGSKAGGSDDYKEKLTDLMNQLQTGSVPEHVAVRNLWASLLAADRILFSSEFPQFMHLVVGLPAGGGPRSKASAAPPQLLAAQLLALPAPVHLPAPMAATMPFAKQATMPFAKPMPFMRPSGLPMGFSQPAVAWQVPGMSPEILEAQRKQREASWADRVSFHEGILRVNMRSMFMSDADIAKWCSWAPPLLGSLSR